MSKGSLLKKIAPQDQALLFGVRCPYCDTSHVLTALGVRVVDDEGETSKISPTLSLTEVDSEGDVVHIRCLSCWEVFGLICVLQMLTDLEKVTKH